MEFFHNKSPRPGFPKRLLSCLMLLSLLLAGCGGQQQSASDPTAASEPAAAAAAVPAETQPADSFLWGSWMNLGKGPSAMPSARTAM